MRLLVHRQKLDPAGVVGQARARLGRRQQQDHSRRAEQGEGGAVGLRQRIEQHDLHRALVGAADGALHPLAHRRQPRREVPRPRLGGRREVHAVAGHLDGAPVGFRSLRDAARRQEESQQDERGGGGDVAAHAVILTHRSAAPQRDAARLEGNPGLRAPYPLP